MSHLERHRSSSCSRQRALAAGSSSAALARPACSVAGSAFLAACGGVRARRDARASKQRPSVNHPKVRDRQLDVLQLAAVHRQDGPEDVRQAATAATSSTSRTSTTTSSSSGRSASSCRRASRSAATSSSLTDYMAGRWVRTGSSSRSTRRTSRTRRTSSTTCSSINYDPKRTFSLPWQSGATGIGYNIKKTGREIKIVKDLFDPKFKGRVTMLSEPYDAANTVLLGDGVDPRRRRSTRSSGRSRRSTRPTRPASSAASPATTTRPTSPRATCGSRWPTPATSSSCRPTTRTCAFAYPEEGAMLFTDNMMMPAQGRAPVRGRDDDELRLRPRGGGEDRAYVNYIPPVKGVKEILAEDRPEARQQPADLPAAEIAEEAAPLPGALPRRRAADGGGDGAGDRRLTCCGSRGAAAAALVLPGRRACSG